MGMLHNTYAAGKGVSRTVVNIAAYKALLVAVAIKARSKAQISEMTGLCPTTVSRWMTVLETGPDRLIYVEAWWRKHGAHGMGCWTAMWRLGYNQPDAPKPRALTKAEYSQRHRDKQAKASKRTAIVDTMLGL